MIHAGCFKDTYYILDVESGSLHEVDEPTFQIAALIEQGITERDEIIRRLSIDPALAEEILDELSELEQAQLFDSQSVAQDAAPQFPKPVVKAMCLHIAHDCNLRCSYCFAAEGSYMGERRLMDAKTAKAALLYLVQASEGRRQLEVDFFGGEPLINFDVVKEAVAYGRQLEKEYNKVIRFTITTNAYHVTDDMIDFINKEMKNLVISIDGRKEIHDAERKNAAGQGSYDKVVKNAKRLIASRGEKEYYIRGTFTARNLDFAKDVASIADLGFDQISIEPVVTAGDLELLPEHLPAIQAEYERLAEYLETRRKEKKPVNFFHFMVDFASGPCLNKRLRGCGAGTEYVAVVPGGDIYPCHQFAGIESFRMGNVFQNTFDSSISDQFAACHIFNKPECQKCWAKYFCSGGCAANAYQTSGNLLKPYPISCETEKARLNIAIALYIRRNYDRNI